MGEIRLDHCCRLCLKEGFSLTNIFSYRSAAGDPLYRILNFIYDIKIFENDGLPPQICSPCMWRMIEFDACKKNVRSAESEIMRHLNQTRPNLGEVSENGLVKNAEETEMDRTCGFEEVHIERDIVQSEVPMKEELDIVESEILREIVMQDRASEVESSEHADHADDMLQIKDEIDIEEWEMPKETPRSSKIIGSTRSSDLRNCLSLEASEETAGNSVEGESSSICNTQDNSVEIRDSNKGMYEKGLRDKVVPEEKSISSELSTSILNVKKSELSQLKDPLCKRKTSFICDICKKRFIFKRDLGNHVRVHHDERPFSCKICFKTFKWKNVKYEHELIHLRYKMNFGKNGMGSKKMLYSCAICAKNFSTKSALSAHSNLHSNKYRCNSCGKSFKDNFHLSRHLRIHTREKPFKCEFCFKCFSDKSALNRHLLIHSSEKSFSCDFCDKRFKSKNETTKHELRHLRSE